MNETGKDGVSTDCTIERLAVVLLQRHPDILFGCINNVANPLRLSVALQNWRELRRDR